MIKKAVTVSFRACCVGAISFVLLLHGAAANEETFTSERYTIRVVTVADDLDEPWSLAWLPDGRMLVTEKPGDLRIVSPDGRVSDPVAGVPRVNDSGQGGLLDVMLDRDFATNNTVYLSYSEPGRSGESGTAVAKATLVADRLENLQVIFQQEPKSRGGRHFGSRLVQARDGTLLITVGERGERSRTQDTTINRGQVIRIQTDGSLPPDNPFVGRQDARPEIWSYGHRNPQGAALHPTTGQLWIHEHGARGGDEINIPLAGRNYGWPVISYGRHYSGAKIGEGTARSGMEQPIYYWDPSIAPSGMAFYTGDKFPEWQGNLLVGALKFRLLARLELDGDTVVREERLLEGIGERIRDVRQGPDGYIYLLTDSSNGRILRLEPETR